MLSPKEVVQMAYSEASKRANRIMYRKIFFIYIPHSFIEVRDIFMHKKEIINTIDKINASSTAKNPIYEFTHGGCLLF